jgi:hypothetical protein
MHFADMETEASNLLKNSPPKGSSRGDSIRRQSGVARVGHIGVTSANAFNW